MNGLFFKFGGTTADKYAGCVFALTGYPESGLEPAANALRSMGDFPGYPTAAERVELLRTGYKNCE